MADQNHSPLLRLPPELRNRIYRMAFEETQIELVLCGLAPEDAAMVPPGILLACRQLYAEATGVFYNRTIFIAKSRIVIVSWLARLPKARVAMLRHVRFDAVGVAMRAGYAEYMMNTLPADLEIRGIILQEGALRASIITAAGDLVWTSTPMETYEASW